MAARVGWKRLLGAGAIVVAVWVAWSYYETRRFWDCSRLPTAAQVRQSLVIHADVIREFENMPRGIQFMPDSQTEMRCPGKSALLITVGTVGTGTADPEATGPNLLRNTLPSAERLTRSKLRPEPKRAPRMPLPYEHPFSCLIPVVHQKRLNQEHIEQ